MVAVVGIIERWGMGYTHLMGVVRVYPEDLVYENSLTEEIIKAYQLWAQMKLEV